MNYNIFRKNHKTVHKIVKFKYFAKVITYSKSQDQLLQNYVYYNTSIF